MIAAFTTNKVCTYNTGNFPVERDTIIGKICISVVMLVTSFIGFIGVSYGEERVTLDEI